jgi:hypothetical protein
VLASVSAMAQLPADRVKLIQHASVQVDTIYTKGEFVYRLQALTTQYAACSCLRSIDGNFCLRERSPHWPATTQHWACTQCKRSPSIRVAAARLRRRACPAFTHGRSKRCQAEVTALGTPLPLSLWSGAGQI